MGLYSKWVLPHVVHLACSGDTQEKQRRKVVPRARGEVLEIGFGSGLNLPHYAAGAVTRLWALEPSAEMLRLAARAEAPAGFELRTLEAGAEAIPLEDASVDTVVITYSLCTIPEPAAALAEMRRVLRPGGRLLFCEHGRSPDDSVHRWQQRMNPLWSRLGGGCHLDREIPALLEAAGFGLEGLEEGYIPGWKPACYNYWGAAA
ncbi:MAG: class I SAM-dependent methyltransferase [Anaerolineae bacterium]